MLTRSIALLVLATAPLAAQKADFRWEKALPAGSTVSLHNINGDVTVSPSTSGKVEVVGIKHGSSRDFDDITLEVVESSRGITVCPLLKDADMECNEDGLRMHSHHRDDWNDLSIDMEVKIPRGMLVDAHSVSGNVHVAGAEDRVRAGSVSGDVQLQATRVSSLKASSVSGDVDVRIESLTGTGDLAFTSVSGDVTVELPKDVDADVSMRSVSGSLDSEFPLTLNGRMNRRNLEARIGKGGRELEVHTVSGDVRLRMVK